jgi:hypothetical protein
MRNRPDRLLYRLFIGSLIVLAAMNPGAVTVLARIATGLILATINGITTAAADQPGPALLLAGLTWIAHQARTHRPRTARTH